MACPSSGTITIQDIVDEFGGSTPHSLSEYYRDGDNVPGNNTNVPTSGAISLSNFYDAVNEIQINLTSDTQDYSCSTGFGANWTSTVPKKLIIASGVTIGATGSNNAITLESGMAGTFTIENSGNIYGYAGTAGAAGPNAGNAGGNGGTGGDAISVNSGITSGVTVLNNSGANIKGGGGGGGGGGAGGAGGTGGTGGQGKTFSDSGDLGSAGGTSTCGANRMSDYHIHCFTQSNGYWQGANVNNTNTNCPDNVNSCADTYGGGAYCGNCWPPSGNGTYPTNNYQNSNAICCPNNYSFSSNNFISAVYGAGNCDECRKTLETITNGGAGGSGGGVGGGGAGGVGAGYDSSAGGSNAGSAGSAGNWGGGGGTNAGSGGQGGTGGTGGTGGAGGALGANGTAGATGSTGATGSSGANGNHSNGSGGSGGSSGSAGGTAGAAGYYIKDPSSAVTLTNNGTVAGNS